MKKAAPSRPEAASPAAPSKAPQHFPALDRQREALDYSANDTEDGMPIKYMTVARAADTWGVAQSRVRQWLADGRIKGAQKLGGIWLIPDKAERPKAAKPGELQAAARHD
jgi:hypothetical protein